MPHAMMMIEADLCLAATRLCDSKVVRGRYLRLCIPAHTRHNRL